MSLKTVRVPTDLEPIFVRAEQAVSSFFAQREEAPGRGTIEICGERYVLVRAASLSVEFFTLVRELYGEGRRPEADEFARNILFDLAHAIGKADAQSLNAKMGLVDPVAQMSAGPVHFAFAGWAFVHIHAESRPRPTQDFFLLYDHPASFEADAWLNSGQGCEQPTCIMGAGYSAGWCEQSFGMRLVACEVQCRACGDKVCRFVMAPPERIEEQVVRYMASSTAPSGRPHGYAVPDLFARKRIEEELRRTQEELEQRVSERTAAMVATNQRLQQEMSERLNVERQLRQAHKLEAVGRLAGGIAHDFNNLLAVILARSDVLAHDLREGTHAEQLETHLQEIQDAVQRASHLTRQLLAFARAQPPRQEVLDLNEVVTRLVTSLIPLVGTDVVVAQELSKEPLLVLGDRGELEQAMMNLVVNARDAMPNGGTLTVTTAPLTLESARNTRTGQLAPGRYVVLRVEDSGEGMSEDVLSKAFDPFFTTKAEGQGTGLGLAMVYGVAQRGEGAVDVVSVEGRGTTFEVVLRRAFRTAAAHGEPRATALPALPQGSETILLVEDQAHLRSAIEEVLRRCGFRVKVAAGPQEALAWAAAPDGAFDLLLTDVVMPHMSGPQLAARVRALRPTVKVVLMSGYSPESLAENADELDARVLAKPFLPHELAQAVRDALDR